MYPSHDAYRACKRKRPSDEVGSDLKKRLPPSTGLGIGESSPVCEASPGSWLRVPPSETEPPLPVDGCWTDGWAVVSAQQQSNHPSHQRRVNVAPTRRAAKCRGESG
ncbi:unnamed protein product [Protopolystoma xenopodis]|uniref:Uncharacterized protein n=1 Tax=Protopolystoma xenopodis TaxID=117903 RepID=A0A3S5CUA7_9PLAT|nr:unnamed protein product [Protopolystoma xenopodis]